MEFRHINEYKFRISIHYDGIPKMILLFWCSKLNRQLRIDGVRSLIREKWQPACLAGNLKSIRYKRALTLVLVKFSLKKSYFHLFISSNFCKTLNHQLVSFSFNRFCILDFYLPHFFPEHYMYRVKTFLFLSTQDVSPPFCT